MLYFGNAKRNEPMRLEPKNPLPENKMEAPENGMAADGYSCLSTADRQTGIRPPVGGRPVYQGPRMSED